jgi:hypothetical protein
MAMFERKDYSFAQTGHGVVRRVSERRMEVGCIVEHL